MAWEAWVVAAIMLLALVLLVTEVFRPEMIMFGALIIVWNAGIITNLEALEGFSNDSLVVVGSMFIVVKGVDRSKLIDRTASATLGENTSQFGSVCRLCALALFFGCLVNNAPLVALFMPIIRDWARSRDFAASKFLMPLSYSSIGGGVITLIGTSTNLVIDGMLQEYSGESFGFFDPARVGFLQNIFTMAYLVTLGVRLLPDEKGGLFRTLKEHKEDMVTELQVPHNFPLVGSNVTEVLEALGIPNQALLKIFRNPPPVKTPASKLRGEAPTPLFFRDSLQPPKITRQNTYQKRTAHAWGNVSRKQRSMSEFAESGAASVSSRNRFMTEGQEADSPMAAEAPTPKPIDVEDMYEIFPVAEHEVLLGGDVLLLSLPREACIKFVNSEQVAKLLDSLAASEGLPGAGAGEMHLRLCDVDLLGVPGRQGEFVELVISPSNPFVGMDFSGQARREFEERYQVAVLAVRHTTWAPTARPDMPDHLLSYANQELTVGIDGAPGKEEEGAGKESTGPARLRSGDAVLVLARGDGVNKLPAQDFLAQTTVANEADFVPSPFDYVPLVLFVIGIVLVVCQQMSMVQVSMTLAAIYLLMGWVSPQDLRTTVDWNMLMLIGSALGLAKGVQASGLSGVVASAVKHAQLGKRGTIFILYFFTMVITELVTNNAAAALAFPLAADISEEMGLQSVKPLAMTVMLATSSCYMNPIGTPPNLMIMGPGGYTFRDFIKVGFLMDIICWMTAGVFVPIMWPMH